MLRTGSGVAILVVLRISQSKVHWYVGQPVRRSAPTARDHTLELGVMRTRALAGR